MKNYSICSRMCDEIAQAILRLELLATDPTKPSYLRVQAQRRLAFVRDFSLSESERPFYPGDDDLPF